MPVMSGGTPDPALERRPTVHAMWRWATPQAQRVLTTGDLEKILRFHRCTNGHDRTGPGELLGNDKSYVSLLELGKRRSSSSCAWVSLSRLRSSASRALL
nr:hypothetical protein GCM10010200_051690 [Actinomadura rugatobispora]